MQQQKKRLSTRCGGGSHVVDGCLGLQAQLAPPGLSPSASLFIGHCLHHAVDHPGSPGKTSSAPHLLETPVFAFCPSGFLNPFLYYIILFKAYSLLPAQEALSLNYTWPLVPGPAFGAPLAAEADPGEPRSTPAQLPGCRRYRHPRRSHFPELLPSLWRLPGAPARR